MSARCHATCSTDRDTGEILCGWVGAWVSACPIAEAAEAGMDERDECDECDEDGDRDDDFEMTNYTEEQK